MSGNGRTPDRTDAKKKFLDGFAEEMTVTAGVKKAGVARSTVYEWRKADADFAKAWLELDDEITEKLEREAYRRAVEGVNTPVFQGGKKVGDVRKYSDRMLEMLLRARAPERYRDRVTVTDEREEAARRELERASEAELDERLEGIGDNVVPIRRAS